MMDTQTKLEQPLSEHADQECPPVIAPSARPRSLASPASKAEIVLRKLRSARGASIADLVELTDWQAHSVRGFLSRTVRKKLGHRLTSEPDKRGVRRYRISNLKG